MYTTVTVEVTTRPLYEELANGKPSPALSTTIHSNTVTTRAEQLFYLIVFVILDIRK